MPDTFGPLIPLGLLALAGGWAWAMTWIIFHPQQVRTAVLATWRALDGRGARTEEKTDA